MIKLFCVGFVIWGTCLLGNSPEFVSASPVNDPTSGPLEVDVHLEALPHPAVVGQPVSVKVQVSAVASALIPDGVVDVQTDQQQTCQITLDTQGEGHCTMTFPTTGRVILRALYLGNSTFLPGSSDKLLLPVVNPGDIPVYQHNFETAVGSEWTKPQREIAPNGEHFLGQFNNGTVSLNLDQLPTHQWLQINFDLYIIRSWDGNLTETTADQSNHIQSTDTIVGPDQWSFQIDQHSFLVTTFSNWSLGNQAFPFPIDIGDFPAQTGAQDINHLGYFFSDIPMDSTYRMSYRLLHNANDLTIEFGALGLQAIEDESWGIDNVSVVVNNAPVYQIFLPVVNR